MDQQRVHTVLRRCLLHQLIDASLPPPEAGIPASLSGRSNDFPHQAPAGGICPDHRARREPAGFCRRRVGKENGGAREMLRL